MANGAELQRQVRRKGGIPTANAKVTRATTVLVKGYGSKYRFGEFGEKERAAARFTRKGASVSLIYDSESQATGARKASACS
jgi:hypothetical protein